MLESFRAKGRQGKGWTAVAAGVGLVAFLPFVRGVLLGHAFYFRDLTLFFFPLRRFLLDGLRGGEFRFWNPYVHEGEQSAMLPVAYPLDLLQLLRPDEAGFSLALALHIALAAIGFLALARHLGASRTAAAGGSLIYALGGFCLSTVNFYVYAEAMAWAPVAVLALLRAREGGPHRVAVAALVVGLTISTGGLEIALQALIVGMVLVASRRDAVGWSSRTALAILLGIGVAGATLLVIPDLMLGSERGGGGFATDVILYNSVHPMSFVQVVVANLYGDLNDMTRYWWGDNFFPKGFPYILSLYLGAPALCLAVVGALGGGPHTRRVTLLAVVAAWLCLGPWGGLFPVVEALPPLLRPLRYPTKAFFTVHFAVALLTSFGLEALVAGALASAWRRLAALALAAGGLLTALSAIPWVAQRAYVWFLAGFFPPNFAWPRRVEDFAMVLRDASTGGLLTGLLGIVAWAVLSGRLRPAHGGLALVSVLGADLLRTGAGLNPMVDPAFFRPSPEMARESAELRSAGRVFACNPMQSESFNRIFWALVELRQPQELLVFAVHMETFSLNFSMPAAIRGAYSRDLTMFVPLNRVLPEEEGCRVFEHIVHRLRRAGVARVLSFDPVHSPDLELLAEERPARLRPLTISVYALKRPIPLRAVAREIRVARSPEEPDALAPEDFEAAAGAALEDDGPDVHGASGGVLALEERPGHLAMTVEADRATAVLVRDPFAPGWSAHLNGRPARVVRTDGGHQAVRIPPGRSTVALDYTPPHLRQGLLLTGGSLLATALLALWGWPGRHRPSPDAAPTPARPAGSG